MSSNYIPQSFAEFNPWIHRLLNYVISKTSGTPPPWPHIPQPVVADFMGEFEAWIRAFEDAEATPTPAKHNERKRVFKLITKATRKFVNQYLRFPPVTDEDRINMGINNHDATPTPHPIPTEKPGTEAVPSGKGRHTVTAINPDTNSKKRPSKATGVAFAYKMRLPTEPQSLPQDMPSEYQTAALRHFQWSQTDYGKVVDYATAYEKFGGGRGPWSDVVSVIIA